MDVTVTSNVTLGGVLEWVVEREGKGHLPRYYGMGRTRGVEVGDVEDVDREHGADCWRWGSGEGKGEKRGEGEELHRRLDVAVFLGKW